MIVTLLTSTSAAMQPSAQIPATMPPPDNEAVFPLIVLFDSVANPRERERRHPNQTIGCRRSCCRSR
jgi:hypothetical protein